MIKEVNVSNEDIENIREKVEILESEVESDFDDEEDEE